MTKTLSLEQVEAELAKSVEAAVPRTVADLLTQLFDQDWSMRQRVVEMRNGGEVTLNLNLSFTVPAQAARLHLSRLMKLEAEGRSA